MKINIPDDLNGKERRRRLSVLTVAYALHKFNNSRIIAANFLGLSERTLRAVIYANKELDIYKYDRGKTVIDKEKKGYRKMKERYPDNNKSELWRGE